MWRRVIPLAAIFIGGALSCMGTLGQGVYHGVPFVEPRHGPFLGPDDTQWQWDKLSTSELMMFWGMILAVCGVLGMAILSVARALKRR